MSYRLDTKLTRNRSRGRGKIGKPRAITIHYWGTWVGQSHAGIVSWLCKWNRRGRTSATYVVSPNHVTQLVRETDTPWSDGSRRANQETISLELCPDPARLVETMATAAALIRDIRGRWGHLPLRRHCDVFNTDCPGPFRNRLGEIDALASGVPRGMSVGGRSKPVPEATKAPAFPLKPGFAYGRRSGPVTWVSGMTYNSHATDDVVKDARGRYYSKGLRVWQDRMIKRGWTHLKAHGGADGLFGNATEKVVRQFQAEKGLVVDGLVGPKTWAAAWEEPVT